MTISEINNGKTWLFKQVSEFDNELHHYCLFFSDNQWGSKRLNTT